MPIMDKIRMAAQRPDCLFAAFPDAGGRVYSPMNAQVRPVRGSAATGVRDVDDGLLTLTKCSVRENAFYFPSPASTWQAHAKTQLDLRGKTPQHTMLMRLRIDYDLDADDSKIYNYSAGMGQSISGRTDNPISFHVVLSNQYKSYHLLSTVCCQSPEEYENNTAVGSSSGGGMTAIYTKAALVNRWMTLGCTFDDSTKQMNIYWDGSPIKSGTVPTWTAARNKFSRYNSSFTQLVFGASPPGTESPVAAQFQWAMLFGRVLAPLEIKYLSED